MDNQQRTTDTKRVIACNYAEATSSVTLGAKAYVRLMNDGWANNRISVIARSRSGRWIEKWESIHRLVNFRTVSIMLTDANAGKLIELSEDQAKTLTDASIAEREQRGLDTKPDVAQLRRGKYEH
jgi:hypothetical protein